VNLAKVIRHDSILMQVIQIVRDVGVESYCELPRDRTNLNLGAGVKSYFVTMAVARQKYIKYI
jgi:hypothetical protein